MVESVCVEICSDTDAYSLWCEFIKHQKVCVCGQDMTVGAGGVGCVTLIYSQQ